MPLSRGNSLLAKNGRLDPTSIKSNHIVENLAQRRMPLTRFTVRPTYHESCQSRKDNEGNTQRSGTEGAAHASQDEIHVRRGDHRIGVVDLVSHLGRKFVLWARLVGPNHLAVQPLDSGACQHW